MMACTSPTFPWVLIFFILLNNTSANIFSRIRKRFQEGTCSENFECGGFSLMPRHTICDTETNEESCIMMAGLRVEEESGVFCGPCEFVGADRTCSDELSDLVGNTFPEFDETSELFNLPESTGYATVFDLLEDTFTSITGTGIILPQIVRKEGDKTLPEIGAEAGVDACDGLDFLEEVDLFAAFGSSFGSSNTMSFCAAVDPCTHTYAIGQANILPELTIFRIITLSLDAIGFSLDKQLSATTHNLMWSGTDESLAAIAVPGHLFVRGTGTIGLDISSLVTVAIEIDAKLLVDADYNSDGIVQPLQDDGFQFSDIDFAFLVSGLAMPVVSLLNTRFDGVDELFTISFPSSQLAADLYTVVSGISTSIQFAVSISISLTEMCKLSPVLVVLCEIFEEATISGQARMYGNSDGFGVMFAVQGKFDIKGDLFDDILEALIDWPSGGASISADISLRYEDKQLFTCASANGGNDVCFSFCSSDNQCPSGKFCSLLGQCVNQVSVAGLCLKNSACKSGFCAGGFCSECPSIDSTEGCADDQFCTQDGLNIGYRCVSKRDLLLPCSSHNACKSGWCSDIGYCSECPNIDSSLGCNSDQYCDGWDYTCKSKKGNGGACLTGSVCASGYCVAGWCRQCPKQDSSEGCNSNQYCDGWSYTCTSKKGGGGTCLSGNVCRSGKCVFGFCT